MSEEAQPTPEEGHEEHAEAADHAPPPGTAPNAVDVAALAERVYQLMRAEVRLEQARLGYAARSGRRGR